MKRTDHEGRIRAKVTYEDRGHTTKCWIWNGKLRKDGRGIIRLDGRDVRVHRAMYELLVGPIPEGLGLDHLCRVPPCCNPRHLEPVTNVENMRRARGFIVSSKRRENYVQPSTRTSGSGANNAAKTHCPHGHVYDDENTRTHINSAGSVVRNCRACDRERAHRRPSRAKTPQDPE